MAWLFVLLVGGNGFLNGQTNDPVIEAQPSGGSAAVGETFAFSVVPGGTSPFSYQWLFNGEVMGAATNSALLLTNLNTGNAGNYSVVITNSVGSITSRVANLQVVTTAPRVLWVKGVTGAGSNIANVPLVLNANGREGSIQFSLRFNTNAFSGPTYTWAPGNIATIISSNLAPGQIGFVVSRSSPGMFPAGQQTLGSVQFTLVGTNTTPLDGGLVFTNDPVLVQAVDTNNLDMLLAASVVPQVEVDPGQPELNLLTGLFGQKVSIANPSAITYGPLFVYVPALGVDTSGNEMSLFSTTSVSTTIRLSVDGFPDEITVSIPQLGSADVDLNGDGTLESAAYFTLSNLPPGAVAVLTNSFYVTDHVTSPVADYYVGIGGTPGVPMPATLAPLSITRAEFNDQGEFELEWPTRPGESYVIVYADDLVNLGDPDLISTSTNMVTGTGSPAQWSDESPAEASRFYQVIQLE